MCVYIDEYTDTYICVLCVCVCIVTIKGICKCICIYAYIHILRKKNLTQTLLFVNIIKPTPPHSPQKQMSLHGFNVMVRGYLLMNCTPYGLRVTDSTHISCITVFRFSCQT